MFSIRRRGSSKRRRDPSSVVNSQGREHARVEQCARRRLVRAGATHHPWLPLSRALLQAISCAIDRHGPCRRNANSHARDPRPATAVERMETGTPWLVLEMRAPGSAASCDLRPRPRSMRTSWKATPARRSASTRPGPSRSPRGRTQQPPSPRTPVAARPRYGPGPVRGGSGRVGRRHAGAEAVSRVPRTLREGGERVIAAKVRPHGARPRFCAILAGPAASISECVRHAHSTA